MNFVAFHHLACGGGALQPVQGHPSPVRDYSGELRVLPPPAVLRRASRGVACVTLYSGCPSAVCLRSEGQALWRFVRVNGVQGAHRPRVQHPRAKENSQKTKKPK